jgi:short subunit fatty acids transporter
VHRICCHIYILLTPSLHSVTSAGAMFTVNTSHILLLNVATERCMLPPPYYLWEFDSGDRLLAGIELVFPAYAAPA